MAKFSQRRIMTRTGSEVPIFVSDKNKDNDIELCDRAQFGRYKDRASENAIHPRHHTPLPRLPAPPLILTSFSVLRKLLAIALRRKSDVIDKVRRVDTKPFARECLPQQAPVTAPISVCVRLYPRVAGIQDCPFRVSVQM